ncbi:very long chain fatty acid elongase 6-like [Branchiostoma floridae x Branchiostoma belcheri]
MVWFNESDVPYPFPLTDFEAGFDSAGFLRWFRTVWFWCFPLSAAYVALVFGGRRAMAAREPFRLTLPLVMWNLGMALFSILGALRYIPALQHTVRHQGFLRSVCEQYYTRPVTGLWSALYIIMIVCVRARVCVYVFVVSVCEQYYTRPVTGLWSALYIFSKIVEFGDTSFIVLRKRPLLFLHWYHHVLTCIYSWYGLAYLVAPARYYGAMNFCIHSLMYTYYAVRAAGVRLPRGLSMVITVLQILQMAAGRRCCTVIVTVTLLSTP